ncbi:hypothetical protein OG741_37685 [Streptomyces sp. NBC_01410]|uniref:hypothetical protein n=1 Tax=Streptomyces sp. NBC_01410 TaxID=2903856 RepID=UPI00324B5AC4
MEAANPQDGFDVPPDRALLVVDMMRYSQIPEAKMAVVRSDLDDILSTEFTESRLPDPRSLGGGYKDTGDGAIFVLPAEHLARLVDPLLTNLNAALQRYDRQRLASSPAIRLRAGIHVGPLTPGHRGDAINEACRLADSTVVRQAMAAAVDNGSFLAAALSETVYRRTVHAGRTPSLHPRQLLTTTARVEGKEGFEEVCRLLVPGLAPVVLEPYLTETDDQPVPQPQSPSQENAAKRQGEGRQADVRQKGKASGKARIVQVGGNYITGPEQS